MKSKRDRLTIALHVPTLRMVDRIAESSGESRSAVMSVILATYLIQVDSGTKKARRRPRRPR